MPAGQTDLDILSTRRSLQVNLDCGGLTIKLIVPLVLTRLVKSQTSCGRLTLHIYQRFSVDLPFWLGRGEERDATEKTQPSQDQKRGFPVGRLGQQHRPTVLSNSQSLPRFLEFFIFLILSVLGPYL